MRVRIVDFVGNKGGGVRYVVESVAAMMREHAESGYELVSHGEALERYRVAFSARGVWLKLVDIEPGVEGSRYDVPVEAVAGCDVAWLPWMHRHRLAEGAGGSVVGTFHDAIAFEFAELLRDVLPAGMLADERETVGMWLESRHRVVVSSQATVKAMGELFGVEARRLDVVPISGEHAADGRSEALPVEWDWAVGRYLICPANISPHKNHEVLLRGVGAWGGGVPLVLTGEATHLHLCKWHRAVALRKVAEESGLVLGKSLITLGYVSEGILSGLMRGAWGLVMPTLAEGGGSFPVAEALHLGVPVICSDIPVIREQMERMGGQVMWFDARDPGDLARRLRELEEGYGGIKASAESQVGRLRRRSWGDVAREYWGLFLGMVNEGKGAHGNDTRLVA